MVQISKDSKNNENTVKMKPPSLPVLFPADKQFLFLFF